MQQSNDWNRFWSRLEQITRLPQVAGARARAERLFASPRRLLWSAGCGVLALVLLGGLLVIHLHSNTAPTALQGSDLDSVPAPAFRLSDQNGKVTDLAQFRGHPIVLTFFDSVCPHADCSLMAAYINATAQDLGAAQTKEVGWVALSLDPWHDTPASARSFLSARNVTIPIHFVLGSVAQMAPLWSSYHMQSILQPDGVVIHSTGVFVIDQHGRERVFLDEGFNPQTLSNDLHMLLTDSGVANAQPSGGSASSGGIQPGFVSLTKSGSDGVVTLIASPGQFGTYNFEVEAWNQQGLPAQGTASIDLSMTAMKMGVLHVPLGAEGSNSPGVYSAQGVLSMQGGWQAVVTVKPVAGPSIQETFDFNAKY